MRNVFNIFMSPGW